MLKKNSLEIDKSTRRILPEEKNTTRTNIASSSSKVETKRAERYTIYTTGFKINLIFSSLAVPEALVCLLDTYLIPINPLDCDP